MERRVNEDVDAARQQLAVKRAQEMSTAFRRSCACRFSDSPVMELLSRLLRDERGQEIIESVLLTAGIGIVTIATWPAIETASRNSYQALDTNTQDLWVPPDPAGGGS